MMPMTPHNVGHEQRCHKHNDRPETKKESKREPLNVVVVGVEEINMKTKYQRKITTGMITHAPSKYITNKCKEVPNT
jgi:hypothetical protein